MNQHLPLFLMAIHLAYYLYFQLFSDFVRSGIVTNKSNKLIAELRTRYHATIKTFQKNNDHYGFAGFKVVYLNENLFIRPNRLLFTFYHEHYHVISHHKRNILLHRILFSCVPLLLYFHWIAALVVYVSAAYLMEIVRRRYENKANAYAKKMYLSGEIKPQ